MPRFPLFTDECVDGRLVKALRLRGWDVEHATEVFGEKNDDEALFAYAAGKNRVFVSGDGPAQHIANRWLAEGRPFRGVIWSALLARKGPVGPLLAQLEEWAEMDDLLANYPVLRIKPRP